MKIKTRFRITMFLFGTVIAAALASIMITDNQARKAVRQEELAARVAQGANELSFLSNDYLIYREDQQIARWQSSFTSFLNQTKALNVDTPEGQMLVRNINENSRRLKETFDSVSSAVPNVSQSGSGNLNLELLRLSSSRLAVQTQGLFSDAQRLSRLLHTRANGLIERRTLLIYALLGVFGLFLFANYILTYRRTMRSMAMLQDGAKIIGSGDLDFRIRKERDDELGEVSDAFNRMAAGLKTVTASKTELEKEMEERKRAEEQIAREKYLQQLLLDHFPGVVLLLRTTTREVVASNQAGKDVGAVCGSKCFETWGQNQVPCPWCLAHDLWATGKEQHTIIEAGEKVFEAHWVPVSDDLYMHYAFDITDRKRAEDILRDKEQLIQQALHIGRAFTFDWDVATDQVYRSDSCKKILGFGDDMVNATSEHFCQHINPDDLLLLKNTFRSLTPTANIYTTDFRFMRSDGNVVTLEETAQGIFNTAGELKRVIGVAADITDRKRAEQKLRESEERFRTLANAMPQLAWMAQPDGYIVWYNQRWYQYTGTTPEQMAGWGWQSVHDPVELPKVLERWKASIATGEPFEMTFPLLGADGAFCLFLTRVFPLKDADGRVVQWFGTNTDVTALKQAEEAIKASLREKEVLLKEIHHRVKNNMQVISSLVSLQAAELQDAGMRAILDEVTHRVSSMALVHEKLYQSADLSRVDFAEYARSLLGYLWRAHGTAVSDIRLTLDLEQVLLTVNLAVPCGLILNELVSNALKHAFHGSADGEVIVSLRSTSQGGVRMSVRDNGAGLPPGFDWRQARSLGLRLVQMLAGQLHADMDIAADGGTEFTITFGGRTK